MPIDSIENLRPDDPEPVSVPAAEVTPSRLTPAEWAWRLLLAAALVFALREMRDVFLPVVLSALLFYALDPLVDWLDRAMPRLVATTLVVAALLATLAGVGYALSGPAIQVVEEVPQAARKFRDQMKKREKGNGALDRLQDAAKDIETTVSGAVETPPPPRGVQRVEVTAPAFRVSDYVWWGSGATLSALSQGVMVVFLTFFLLLSNDLYKRKLVSLAGPRLTQKKLTVQVIDSIGTQIERFLLVQVFTSLVVGLVTWAVLAALGVRQAAVWGAAAGVLNSIPYLGPLIVTVGLAVVAFLQFGTFWMAGVVAFAAMVITAAEGWLLTPALLSRAAEMNQAAVFVSLLFWTWVWGPWGTFLAIPVMMVIKSVADHVEELRPISELLGE